ncbi:MAG: efflux RND transporter periplasmic adaptor subunit [Thermoanaerobaculia bacterium]|nr:efflux RND transporter periplasmic adaptor subunit [Thermoanaerobaculia bacterium]
MAENEETRQDGVGGETTLEETHPDFDAEYFERDAEPPKGRRIRRRVIALVAVAVVAVGGFFVVQVANGDEEKPANETGEEVSATDSENEKTDEGQKPEDGDAESEKEEEEETRIPVEVTDVERDTVAAYIAASANLVPDRDVRVIAEAEGRIEKLLVEEGDRVKAGQPLVRLVQDDTRIALQKAKARLANAEQAFERAERMKEQEVISNEEFDLLSMEYRVAQQEVAEAEWALSKRTVRAPFDGQITERFVDLGQNVKLSQELFSLASYDPLVARIYLPEKEVLGLEPGREVSLALAADESIRFSGEIQKISPIVDTATGTVKVTVEATEKPAQVRPGGFVTVRIVRERREGVPVVPRESVIRELNQAHVFVADGSKAAKRPVEVGMEEGEKVEITEGLEPGEKVITAGQGGLKDGDEIKVLEPAQVADFAPEKRSSRKG